MTFWIVSRSHPEPFPPTVPPNRVFGRMWWMETHLPSVLISVLSSCWSSTWSVAIWMLPACQRMSQQTFQHCYTDLHASFSSILTLWGRRRTHRLRLCYLNGLILWLLLYKEKRGHYSASLIASWFLRCIASSLNDLERIGFWIIMIPLLSCTSRVLTRFRERKWVRETASSLSSNHKITRNLSLKLVWTYPRLKTRGKQTVEL